MSLWNNSSAASAKYSGLQNQGATCYLNSVLQVLFMTEDFREAARRHVEQNTNSDHIDHQLNSLFFELNRNQADTFDITTKLGIKQVNKQQDAAEYFEKILRLTSEDASQIFHGMLTHRTKCLKCDNLADADTLFWNLCLRLVDSFGEYDVVDGIHDFFQPSQFSGENQMYCERCDDKQDAMIQCVVKNHPEVLMLLLKRFELNYFTMTYVKNNRCVRVPLTLLIPENQMYELYAMVNHYGELSSGHYDATIKSQEDDLWYEFDDSRVTLSHDPPFRTNNNERSAKAYLLFYRKKSAPAADTGSPQDIREVDPKGVSVKEDKVRDDTAEPEPVDRGEDMVNVQSWLSDDLEFNIEEEGARKRSRYDDQETFDKDRNDEAQRHKEEPKLEPVDRGEETGTKDFPDMVHVQPGLSQDHESNREDQGEASERVQHSYQEEFEKGVNDAYYQEKQRDEEEAKPEEKSKVDGNEQSVEDLGHGGKVEDMERKTEWNAGYPNVKVERGFKINNIDEETQGSDRTTGDFGADSLAKTGAGGSGNLLSIYDLVYPENQGDVRVVDSKQRHDQKLVRSGRLNDIEGHGDSVKEQKRHDLHKGESAKSPEGPGGKRWENISGREHRQSRLRSLESQGEQRDEEEAIPEEMSNMGRNEESVDDGGDGARVEDVRNRQEREAEMEGKRERDGQRETVQERKVYPDVTVERGFKINDDEETRGSERTTGDLMDVELAKTGAGGSGNFLSIYDLVYPENQGDVRVVDTTQRHDQKQVRSGRFSDNEGHGERLKEKKAPDLQKGESAKSPEGPGEDRWVNVAGSERHQRRSRSLESRGEQRDQEEAKPEEKSNVGRNEESVDDGGDGGRVEDVRNRQEREAEMEAKRERDGQRETGRGRTGNGSSDEKRRGNVAGSERHQRRSRSLGEARARCADERNKDVIETESKKSRPCIVRIYEEEQKPTPSSVQISCTITETTVETQQYIFYQKRGDEDSLSDSFSGLNLDGSTQKRGSERENESEGGETKTSKVNKGKRASETLEQERGSDHEKEERKRGKLVSVSISIPR